MKGLSDMNKVSRWRKVFYTLIIGILCVALMTGCSFSPDDSDGKKPSKKPTSSESKSDNDISSEDDLQPDGSTNNDINSTNGTVEEGVYTEMENGLVKSQTEFNVKIPDYNPGIPGYDTKYSFVGYFDGKILNVEDVSCSADIDGIIIDGNNITIPESINNSHEGMTLRFTYNKDKRYYYETKVKFKHWEPTLMDEFDEYNTDIWDVYEKDCVRGDNHQAINAGDGVHVKHGKMIVEAKKLDEPYIFNGKEYYYTNGTVSTQNRFTQRFGCFTALIKMPEEGATLSGFWLMPPKGYGSSMFSRSYKDDMIHCAEIDIVETRFAQTGFAASYTEHMHYSDATYVGGAGANFTKTFENYEPGSFHEYTLVWTEYATYSYVDGELLGKNEEIVPGDQPGHIIFTLYTAPPLSANEPDYSGWYGYADEDDYYVSMEIDWLHVYK